MHQIGNFSAPDFVLARKTIDIRAGPPDPPPLDDYRLLSGLCQMPGKIFSTLAAADDDFLMILHTHIKILSSRCCLRLRGLLWVPCRFPFDPLQIEYKNRVEDRDQEQGDEGSDRESANLGIAQRFPERATFECKRKQSEDSCAHGDHHGPNALNTGIGKSTLQRLALFVHLLNEIEQHNDMAYDDSNQAGYSKKCHEAKRRAHDCQGD